MLFLEYPYHHLWTPHHHLHPQGRCLSQLETMPPLVGQGISLLDLLLSKMEAQIQSYFPQVLDALTESLSP